MKTWDVKAMTIRNKIYGGAGCGKTYHLLSELEGLLGAGADINAVSMLTLTRAARKEFVQRAYKLTGKAEKNLQWFGTMHQIAWRMLKLSYKQHAVDRKAIANFADEYEPQPTGRLPALTKIDQVRRNCMHENSPDGLIRTHRATGINFQYRDRMTHKYKDLPISQIVSFSKQWHAFMDHEDRFDFTKIIEIAVREVAQGDTQAIFEYMFVDEFQDFSPLQHALYQALAKDMNEVWFCGDDWQVIYRFAGASPDHLINETVSPGREVILPRTYRYGRAGLENSLRYIRKLAVLKERDIHAADHKTNVQYLHGAKWQDHIHTDNTTSAYLTRTNSQAKEIAAILKAKGLIYRVLGQSYSKSAHLLQVYNSLATLERGDVLVDDDIRTLISALPATTMIDAQQTTIDGQHSKHKIQLLKPGTKARVASPDYLESLNKQFYTAAEFAMSFLSNMTWRDVMLIDHVKGMPEFIAEKGLKYPTPHDVRINHVVGTIHKFKGNEADNVFLFKQLPYPISDNVLYGNAATRDAERRTFYVGATRMRHNLYEVNAFFRDYRGNLLPSIDEIL